MEQSLAPPAPRAESEAAFARAALVAGSLSLLACSLWLYWMVKTGSDILGIRHFTGTGAAIALIAVLAGRSRRPPARPLPSAGNSIWQAILPPLVAGLGASALFLWNGAAYSMGVVWIVCYGLILLNLRPYVAGPIARTGWLFLGTGVTLMTVVYFSFKSLAGYDRSDTQTLLIMALTFGGFHLLHALGYFLNRRAGSET